MNLEPRTSNLESDKDERRRAVEETAQSFIVEASAGTGKTHTLIDRILHLILEKGPRELPVPLSQICAITFTEKAAGEMKIRLRQNLEQTLLDVNASTGRLERARQALRDLETASISTFHSFAVSLLKERPIEAGLDPRFTALDEIRSQLFFKSVWDPWIHRMLTERNPTLEKALRNGFTLEKLEDLAGKLRFKWLQVRNLECDPPLSEMQCMDRIQNMLQQGHAFKALSLKSADKLVGHLADALNWLEHSSEATIELSSPGNAGSAANWEGGKATVQTVRYFIKEVIAFHELLKSLPAQKLLHEIVCWTKQSFMTDEWEKKKQSGGLLDFDDQLRLAWDLLRKNKDVRSEFQRQFKILLVDEFQDTDPIQWEIVLLLTATDFKEDALDKLEPGPGRLFIVGDPKQSIYRFRNADIETYLRVADSSKTNPLGLKQLNLTTNYRSVPSILRFVDAAFGGAMKPTEETCRYQPHYLPFGDHGDRGTELRPPAVSLLGDVNSDDALKRKTAEFIEIESDRIAGLIERINGSEEWKIQDPGKKGKNGWRVPQFGDVAILLPVLTHAEVLEEKLRIRGIPYVLEGGKFYYSRSEVSSAILALRAVANPNDKVALYGSLRSIFFGLSDEELLRTHIDKLPLDYREEVPSDSPLYRPFEILRDLHLHRHERRASETFEILLQRTGAREVLAVRGFQSLANLGKLARTLRALQEEMTFLQVVNLLSGMDEEGLAESESRLMEEHSNSVRIMTIHKAKGLDFPIVVVAALGLEKRSQPKYILSDPIGKKLFAVHVPPKESGWQTPGWKELLKEEKERENAELVRLLYVGMTRARDHLVLSIHTGDSKILEDSKKYIPDMDGTRLSPLGLFLEDCFLGKSNLARLIDVKDLAAVASAPRKEPIAGAASLETVLLKEYAELQSLLANTPASGNLKAAGQGIDSLDPGDRPREERMPEVAGNRSIRLGIALHEAMERVDLVDPKDLPLLIQESALRHGLDTDGTRMMESMLRACLSSELLYRARAAIVSKRMIFREFPFVRPTDDGAIEEGKIDLLFEEEDGWILVDYKTDWVAERSEGVEELFQGKYVSQIRAYLTALRALSIPVKSAYLLLARTGESIRMI